MENCTNHPDRKALSVCHGCGKNFCESCLDEGKEFYYCKNPACQELLRKETTDGQLPSKVICPSCSNELELTDEERASQRFHCPECESFVDFTESPPKIFNAENYSLLLTSMNQGDIAVIKSILENSDIDYYVFGEDFLAVRPLVQPARFFVADSQMGQAKELLKNFEIHFFGVSNRNNVGE